jgi:hypothetical protein
MNNDDAPKTMFDLVELCRAVLPSGPICTGL